MAKLTSGWQNSKILGHVFDQLSDALVLYDANHVITGVNAAAERMFSIDAQDIVGRDCREMFHCEMCDAGCGLQAGLVQGNGQNATVRLHTEAGLERLVLIHTAQLFADNGALEGAVATIKEVTAEVEPQKREIVSESPGMRDVLNFVRRVAIS
jgi:PAS domain S-box-containing protein